MVPPVISAARAQTHKTDLSLTASETPAIERSPIDLKQESFQESYRIKEVFRTGKLENSLGTLSTKARVAVLVPIREAIEALESGHNPNQISMKRLSDMIDGSPICSINDQEICLSCGQKVALGKTLDVINKVTGRLDEMRAVLSSLEKSLDERFDPKRYTNSPDKVAGRAETKAAFEHLFKESLIMAATDQLSKDCFNQEYSLMLKRYGLKISELKISLAAPLVKPIVKPAQNRKPEKQRGGFFSRIFDLGKNVIKTAKEAWRSLDSIGDGMVSALGMSKITSHINDLTKIKPEATVVKIVPPTLTIVSQFTKVELPKNKATEVETPYSEMPRSTRSRFEELRAKRDLTRDELIDLTAEDYLRTPIRKLPFNREVRSSN